jgi:hypothetical protein
VHFICPQLLEEAIGSGITTMIGGGTGPAEGSKATTVTPGAWHLGRMLQALDGWPMNILLLGKGNTINPDSMWEQLRGGAAGFKLHEDWGTTPATIDACLRVAEEADVQVALHSDTLNEMGFVEDTLAAIAGRAIHAYHTEGAGGGHAPDIITVASHPNVMPSSTNPTRPHTVNTLDEHLDMLMVCHHLNAAVPEDLDPEPTVIAGGSSHLAVTRLRIEEQARVRLRERVQIGRTGESHGFWSGVMHADRDAVPLLRHRVELGDVVDDELAAPRACVSEFRYPDSDFGAIGNDECYRSRRNHVVMSLAVGGCLATWQGGRL